MREASEVDDAVSGIRHCGVDGFLCGQRDEQCVVRKEGWKRGGKNPPPITSHMTT